MQCYTIELYSLRERKMEALNFNEFGAFFMSFREHVYRPISTGFLPKITNSSQIFHKLATQPEYCLCLQKNFKQYGLSF